MAARPLILRPGLGAGTSAGATDGTTDEVDPREQPRVVGQTPHERMIRAESATAGIDEVFQTVGADPYGRQADVGLRVPALVLPGTTRYLFLLSLFSVARGKTARLRGYRQLVKLGANAGTGEPVNYRPVEFNVTDPQFHPPGGNISWHLQDLGVKGANGIPGIDPKQAPPIPELDNFAWRMSTSPALLFETATIPAGNAYYISMTAYTPPNGGLPYGVGLLDGGFSTFYDLRTPWQASQAWHSLDVELVGPRTVALFASVKQTNPSETPNYALPEINGGATGYGSGISPEEAFLVNFPLANYWRVGGSLVVDT